MALPIKHGDVQISLEFLGELGKARARCHWQQAARDLLFALANKSSVASDGTYRQVCQLLLIATERNEMGADFHEK